MYYIVIICYLPPGLSTGPAKPDARRVVQQHASASQVSGHPGNAYPLVNVYSLQWKMAQLR